MPRPVQACLTVLGAWIVACELHGLGLRGIPLGSEKWLHLVVMGAGAALCLSRAAMRREERAAWALLGLGVLAWTLGELYFTVALWSDASPPSPSWADAGYMALPPLVFAGLVVLARRRVHGLTLRVWVDAATAGLAVSAVSAAIVVEPVLASVSHTSLSAVSNLTYPVLDLMMLGLVGGLLAIGGRRADYRLAVIGFGILCFWGADTIYLIRSAQGTWVSGGPYDPGWWTISICIAAAAWLPARVRTARWEPRSSIRVPVGFALVALGVLIIGTFTVIGAAAVVLAGGALLGIVGRLVLTFRDHEEMLQVSRGEATTDALTGLGNRRALSAALERVLDDDQPSSVILALFDLDGFKSYNDSFGHAAGDGLLRRLATSLDAVLTPPARAFRMGGDEFCVLLPGGAAGQQMLRAAGNVLYERGEGFAIGASMGSVALPHETTDIGEALRLADQRMYARKHSTRRAGAAHEVKGALLSALAHRDPSLSDHLDGVGRLAVAIAEELGCPPPEVERVGMAAELHDVGKVAIPEAILRKPGPLSAQEWALMRQHTIIGQRIVSAAPTLAEVGTLVRSSHERWDGGGYPDGLAGEQIPLGARIIVVCDSFDAMTSDRSYRQAMSEEVALAELRAGAGSQFDPGVVDTFLRVHAREHAVVAAPAVRAS